MELVADKATAMQTLVGIRESGMETFSVAEMARALGKNIETMHRELESLVGHGQLCRVGKKYARVRV